MINSKAKSILVVFILFVVSTTGVNAQFTNFSQNQSSQQGGYNNYYGANDQGYNYNQGYSQQQQQQQLPPLQGSVMVAPAGTSLAVTATTSLSSAVSRVGDPIITRLSSDLYASGGLLLPAGSIIEGRITEVQSAGRTGKNGMIAVRFTTAQTPNGQRVPISARIATEDGTGIIKGGSTAGRVGKTFLQTAIGAGIGAALGTALAPAAGGRVGKGAAYGTAIGAGAGLLSNLARTGKEAELPSGTQLQVVLDQPLTLQGSGQAQQGQNYGTGYGGGYNSNGNYNYDPYGGY